MLRSRIAFLITSGVLVLALVGCGGSGAVDLGPAVEQSAQAVAPLPAGALRQVSAVAEPVPQDWYSDTRLNDSPLTAVTGKRGRPISPPVGDLKYLDIENLGELPPFAAPNDGQSRQGSAVQPLDISSPAMTTANVVASPGSLLIPSAVGETEWARFFVTLNEGEDLVAFSTDGTLLNAAHGEDSGLWVGVSNYTLGHWVFYGPYSLTAQVIVNLPAANYLDITNTAHLVLITSDGDSVDVSQLQIDAQSAGPSEILPQEFYTALTSAGLNAMRLSMAEMDTFGSGQQYNLWGWYLYQYEPDTNFEDLRTLLPSYWSGWYGSDDPGFFQPAEYGEYVNDKAKTMDEADELLDILMAGIDEFPADKRVVRQTYTPTLALSDKLAHAIADYVDASGGTSDFVTYQTALSAMPDDQQVVLARVVLAARDAIVARDDVFYDPEKLGFPDEATVQDWFDFAQGAWVPTTSYVPALIDTSGGAYFMRGWPYNTAYFEGAVNLTSAIDQLTAYINDNNPTWENVSLDVDTDWGRITIGGTGNDSYVNPDANGYAVLIDAGGMDTYDCTAGATSSGKNGVAVAIDLGTDNDTHVEQDEPLDGNRNENNDDNTSQQGAGRMGIGIFVDYGGQDNYSAVRMSQGFAMLGVGILADYGNEEDIYNLEGYGQGGAIGGIGILYDDGGYSQDIFNIWGFGQGYGGVMGVGLLVHHGDSDDIYYAEPTFDASRPEYNSGQLPDEVNANFAQGAAFGMRWGVYQNPNSGKQFVAAGGYGLLYDQDGYDDYECGVFGQAASFFHGHGLLIDQGGFDNHYGRWYTQGATAHCGLACIWDGGGDDTWNNDEYSIGIGGAHDWSVTWFFERGGNDTYDASPLAVGTGYNNAFAYFIEMSGNDEYRATYSDGAINNLGRGGWPADGRDNQPSYGIFLDVRGQDTYDPEYATMLSGVDASTVIDTPPDDDTQWVRVNGNPAAGNGFYELGYGSGLDVQ